jgi:hypothetical protein
MLKSFLSFILCVSLFSCTTNNIHTDSSRYPANANVDSDCRDVARAFIQSNPVKSGPILRGQNSLASKISNFDQFRSDMLNKRPSLDKYKKKQQELGNNPTVKDAMIFFRDAHADITTHIRSAMGTNEELDQYLEMGASQIELNPSKLDKLSAYLSDSEYRDIMNSPFDISESSQRQLFDSLGWTNYKGHLGELDVLLRLENLQAQGVYLTKQELLNPKAQEVNNIVSRALESKLESVNVSQIPELKQKYPKVFKDSGDISDEEILRRAKTFLETKEFDLIVKKHGRYSIVEVKNYKHAISMSDMRVDSGNKKTILDQQLETIDIIKFLGLEDKLYPSVAFLRGVTPEAKAKLESHGISVLADVVD